MEQKHEIWVHDLTTFLHANLVQTYEGGWNSNSLEGMKLPKGKTLEPSERLNIFQATLAERVRQAQRTDKLFTAELRAHKDTQLLLKTAEDMLEEQKEVAQRLSLSLSTRFFAILEELAHDPECGVQYYTCDKDTGEKTHLGHASVKGIMAAIFTKFQEMGDWSPMQALQGELKDEQELNVRFENLLEKVHQADGSPLALELRRQVEELLHLGESEAPT